MGKNFGKFWKVKLKAALAEVMVVIVNYSWHEI